MPHSNARPSNLARAAAADDTLHRHRLMKEAAAIPPQNPRHWAESGVEPDIHDMLTDPILKLVLLRDGIDSEAVLDAVRDARRRLRAKEVAAAVPAYAGAALPPATKSAPGLLPRRDVPKVALVVL